MKKIIILCFLTFLQFSLEAWDEERTIRNIFVTLGIPSKTAFSNELVIEKIQEGNNSQIFRITINDSSSSHISYLKFSQKEGSKGAFYIKPLFPIDNITLRMHSEKRRDFFRKAIKGVNELIPREKGCEIFPYSLPLNVFSTIPQNTVEPIYEYRLYTKLNGQKLPSTLQNSILTRWSPTFGIHISMKKQSLISVFDPINYPASTIKKILQTLIKFQYESTRWIQAEIQKKTEKNSLPPDTIEEKIYNKLQHESRSFCSFTFIYQSLIQCFHLPDQPIEQLIKELKNPSSKTFIQLKAAAQEKKAELIKYIHQIINDLGGKDEGDIINAQELFFAQNPPIREKAPLNPMTPQNLQTHPVNKMIFTAERDHLIPHKYIVLGKKICCALETESIIDDIVYNQANRLIEIFEKLAKYQKTFFIIETMPMGVCLQSPHPYSFIYNKSGSYSIMATDDISWDTLYLDFAQLYIQKIIRGILHKRISLQEGMELMQAAVDGYNHAAPTPLPKEHLGLLCDILIIRHWSFLSQIPYYYNLKEDDLNTLNLSVTTQSFLDHLYTLEHYKKFYLEQMIQGIRTTSPPKEKTQDISS
ncbi:MAG: hypothetical protein JW769_01010 [Parachlamydiales bacterium]|nr:hypothetical protein [Parachlamydiales bacterium]